MRAYILKESESELRVSASPDSVKKMVELGISVNIQTAAGQDSNFSGLKSTGTNSAADANGYGDFYYAPPSGFLSLNSASTIPFLLMNGKIFRNKYETPNKNIIDSNSFFILLIYYHNISKISFSNYFYKINEVKYRFFFRVKVW